MEKQVEQELKILKEKQEEEEAANIRSLNQTCICHEGQKFAAG